MVEGIAEMRRTTGACDVPRPNPARRPTPPAIELNPIMI
jgi:hypothetical protein